MTEVQRYSITSEVGVPYNSAVNQYLLSRIETLTSRFLPGDCFSPHMSLREMNEFVYAIAKAAPIYLVEQFAPNSKSYSSLRGAGYSQMSLAIARRSIFNRGGIEAVMLNHEFRASANALDAAVDESKEILTREDIRRSPITRGFRDSKSTFFMSVRKAARHYQGEDMMPFGNAARRYQMHLDLYLDFAVMKRHGIDKTKYFKNIPQLPNGFLLSREQAAHLLLMGMNGETLLADTLIPVAPRVSGNSEARDAGFWAAIMGSLGDQWADVLQDLCNDSVNMFVTVLDNFPDKKKRVMSQLSPLVGRAKDCLANLVYGAN